MKLLGIVLFFLAVLCVCTVGEVEITGTPVSPTTSASGSKSVTEPVNASTIKVTTSQRTVPVTTSQAAVPVTTAIGATNESITNTSTSLPNATQGITQDETTQLLVKVKTARTEKSFSTINTTQASGTQLPQNESSDASPTKGSFFNSTVSLERDTPSSRTSGLPVTSSTKSATSGSDGQNKDGTESDTSYSSIILPIVITLIVITLSVFSLVALYRMCQKKSPERQENGTEQAQSDKDGVKLLSVKTTSPETVFVEARDICEVGFSLPSANLCEPTSPPPSGEVSQGRTTGEHSSQGKSKTRQFFTSQQ